MPTRRHIQRRRRSLPERVVATVVRNPRKVWGTVALILGAPAAIVGFYNYVEPWFYTSHWYARDLTATVQHDDQAKIEALRAAALSAVQRNYAATRDTQLELAEGKRDQAANDIIKWKVELTKAVTSGDQESQEMANKQIISLGTIVDKLNNQIKTLTAGGSAK